MTDTRTPNQRSRIMKAVGTKNTGPELALRKLIYHAGYRYRLHEKKLPGRPDLVFPSRQRAIFVHGCFWHGHDCSKGKAPKSKLEYWVPKLVANKARDARNINELRQLGWDALVIWQCELADPVVTLQRVEKFLQSG